MGSVGKIKGFSISSSSSSAAALVLFPLVFLAQESVAISTSDSLNYTTFRPQISSLRLARIQRHLDRINKPPVLTIQSPDGDIIDCVHRRKQPALDHPLLKNHKIQRVPSAMPKAMRMVKTDAAKDNANTTSGGGSKGVRQTWHQDGRRCPKGTVPIRRSTVHDVLRAKSLYDFGKKKSRYTTAAAGRRPEAPDVVSGNGHEHAIAYTTGSGEVYGAKATINVWDPRIEVVNEFSLSQIWVLSGSFDGSDLNSIEAGWQDPNLGNWWMGFGENTLVGYWPTEIFSHLADRATMVEWGGEVVNSRANGHHTLTQMGSGHFPEEGFAKASYFRNLEIVDSDNSLSSAHDISTLAENTNCYNIKSSYNNEWGTHFYYGGPGKSPQCP
ncbi:hypothetical protein Sango_2704100 [Sesamum angolense]|uniref:Neprosin PEP catalytic domain-containing protein n=1 Tax=Sesamum angolense TaxID=2727404 RepID=A0AAE1W2Y3_9LAMI|nr:hypothetical protein Sango_2704100 [Sesamum angolense]